VGQTNAKSISAFKLNEKRADAILAQRSSTEGVTSVARILSQSQFEETEDVLCTVNPILLWQYLYGYIMRPLAGSDNAYEYANSLSVCATIINNWNNLNIYFGGIPFPKPLVRLFFALQSRRVGRTNYIVDYNALGLWNTYTASTGIGTQNFDRVISTVNPASYNTSGFANVSTWNGSFPLNYITRHFALFASYFELINFTSFKDDPTDASAFAFDVGGAVDLADLNFGGNCMAAFAGFQNGTGPVLSYIRQTGAAGLETKIKSPDLASIRLCTQVPCYLTPAGNSNQNSVILVRRPSFILNVDSLPSVLGYNASRHLRIPGKVQLKPVPVQQSIQNIITRLEAVFSSNTALQTQVTGGTGFGQNDVIMLAIGFYKMMQRKFSGAYNGACLISKGVSNRGGFPECHAGYLPFYSCRIPEFVARALGSVDSYTDAKGTLLPFAAYIPVTGYTFTLTYTFTSPITTINTENLLGIFNGAASLATKYRKLEPLMAGSVNMFHQNNLGPSLLDVTTLIGTVSSYVTGLTSRRPLDDATVQQALDNVAWIGYDYVDDNNLPSTGISLSSKEYRQYNRRDLSNIDSPAVIAALSVSDGIVPSGFTSNIDNAKGTDNRMDRAEAVPLQAPPVQVLNLLAKTFSDRFLPTHGNYCGLGWTAGVHPELVGEPDSVDGQYLVQPTDPEDAICKAHDEAYLRANNDPDKILAADERMNSQLDELRRLRGLSAYGRGMRIAIGAKATVLKAMKGKKKIEHDEL
jgi:hypothetical protein